MSGKVPPLVSHLVGERRRRGISCSLMAACCGGRKVEEALPVHSELKPTCTDCTSSVVFPSPRYTWPSERHSCSLRSPRGRGFGERAGIRLSRCCARHEFT